MPRLLAALGVIGIATSMLMGLVLVFTAPGSDAMKVLREDCRVLGGSYCAKYDEVRAHPGAVVGVATAVGGSATSLTFLALGFILAALRRVEAQNKRLLTALTVTEAKAQTLEPATP